MSAVVLPRGITTAMVEHARYESPLEACGLLAVTPDRRVRFAYCLTNVDASNRSFTVGSEEFFGASRHAERHGWEIGGLFHSHPTGPPVPSATDVANAPSATWIYVVVGGEDVGAFEIVGGRPRTLTIEIDR